MQYKLVAGSTSQWPSACVVTAANWWCTGRSWTTWTTPSLPPPPPPRFRLRSNEWRKGLHHLKTRVLLSFPFFKFFIYITCCCVAFHHCPPTLSKWRSTRAHQLHLFRPKNRSSPQWLIELWRLWTSAPWLLWAYVNYCWGTAYLICLAEWGRLKLFSAGHVWPLVWFLESTVS